MPYGRGGAGNWEQAAAEKEKAAQVWRFSFTCLVHLLSALEMRKAYLSFPFVSPFALLHSNLLLLTYRSNHSNPYRMSKPNSLKKSLLSGHLPPPRLTLMLTLAAAAPETGTRHPSSAPPEPIPASLQQLQHRPLPQQTLVPHRQTLAAEAARETIIGRRLRLKRRLRPRKMRQKRKRNLV